MNKSELAKAISAKTNLTQKQAGAALDAIIASIEDTVTSGDKLALIGFGTFEAKKYAATKARNPRTGETVAVPAKTVPVFKAGKSFKEKVNK